MCAARALLSRLRLPRLTGMDSGLSGGQQEGAIIQYMVTEQRCINSVKPNAALPALVDCHT